MRWVGFGLLVLALLGGREARADKVDRQIRQLSKGSYKVRLSAVLALSKNSDARSVRAMTRALKKDGSKTIRRVAAVSLGRMVSSETDARTLKTVKAALSRSLRRDKSSRVRSRAAVALKKVKSLGTGSGSGSSPARSIGRASGSVYIHVGTAQDRTRALPRPDRSKLQQMVGRTLKAKAPRRYQVETNKRALPTASQMASSRSTGFYVGAHVADLRVRRLGSQAEVRCSVKVRVSPWTGRGGNEKLVAAKSASASGSARVVGSASRSGIKVSKRDCVLAVAEEITSRQVVPFLRKASR